MGPVFFITLSRLAEPEPATNQPLTSHETARTARRRLHLQAELINFECFLHTTDEIRHSRLPRRQIQRDRLSPHILGRPCHHQRTQRLIQEVRLEQQETGRDRHLLLIRDAHQDEVAELHGQKLPDRPGVLFHGRHLFPQEQSGSAQTIRQALPAPQRQRRIPLGRGRSPVQRGKGHRLQGCRFIPERQRGGLHQSGQ